MVCGFSRILTEARVHKIYEICGRNWHRVLVDLCRKASCGSVERGRGIAVCHRYFLVASEADMESRCEVGHAGGGTETKLFLGGRG